ncbi:MAG: hypothetical protein GWM93_02085, partial [Gemmatimonadetes bacterium]|nr:hypothetical protein [Gemmatimonadota bacterium]NIY34050.1 hypothetical protein [Gemmatimonadota bacterium]
GDVIQTVRTDRFGLYRFDRVVVGRYTVRLAAANAPRADITWPSRTVEVNDFLFGQDLELSRLEIDGRDVPAGLNAGQGQG